MSASSSRICGTDQWRAKRRCPSQQNTSQPRTHQGLARAVSASGLTVLFFDLAEQTPEVLLTAPGAWLPTMALVRAEREAAEAYLAYTADVVRHIEPLSESNPARWRDLLGLILSWGLRRRPRQEQEQLLGTVMSSHNSVILQREVAAMSRTVVQTWEEEVFARGLLRASRDHLCVVLEERFGTLTEAMVQRIQATDDLGRLEAALRQGVRITARDQLQL